MEACPGVPVVSMHQVVGGELLELLLFGQQRTVQLPVENENHCVDHGPESLNCSTSWLPPCLGGSVGREPDSLLDALPWSANEIVRLKKCAVFDDFRSFLRVRTLDGQDDEGFALGDVPSFNA